MTRYCRSCDSPMEQVEGAVPGTDKSEPVFICLNEGCILFNITQEWIDEDEPAEQDL